MTVHVFCSPTSVRMNGIDIYIVLSVVVGLQYNDVKQSVERMCMYTQKSL